MTGACPHCTERADPSRTCVWQGEEFRRDNYGCHGVEALLDAWDPERMKRIYGADESLDLIPCNPNIDGGWIVITRYKRRFRVSSLTHVGDHLPKPVTWALVERTIAYLQTGEGRSLTLI